MKISDEKLYELCKTFGKRARLWRQKFMGLLPEVFRRRLYEKKGFGSIFEFATKLGGISKEQVQRVLNLEKNFSETPVLKSLLENGEVSVNKLARVASMVTPGNEEFWAEQVQLLPKNALETLIKDEKISALNEDKNGLQKGFFDDNSVPGHRIENGQELKISEEIKQKLLDLQSKGINIDELLREFLEKRELEIAQEKEQIAQEIQETAQTAPRFIPVKIQRLIEKEHGTKCSIPTCKRQAQTIHHTQRFALAGNHNPHYLAPLCKEHHIIAHSTAIRFIALNRTPLPSNADHGHKKEAPYLQRLF